MAGASLDGVLGDEATLRPVVSRREPTGFIALNAQVDDGNVGVSSDGSRGRAPIALGERLDQDARHLHAGEQARVAVAAGIIVVSVGDEQIVAVAQRLGFRPARNLQREPVTETGKHESEDALPATGEQAGTLVGRVAQAIHSVAHELHGGGLDLLGMIEHVGHGAERHPRLASHVLNGDLCHR